MDDAAVQSLLSEPGEGYWSAMVPQHRPSRVLLLGLGAGTIARLICARFGPIPIVGVEDDSLVLAHAERELHQLTSLEIVHDDAFRYVATTTERFSVACVDLYRGAQFQGAVVGRPFLRRLKQLLAPRGTAVFNLFADRRAQTRVHRINKVLNVGRQIPIGRNLVVWCR